MEKAYDVKELGKIIKEEAEKEGLTLAEEAVEKLGKAGWAGVKRFINESAALSENKIDDVIAPALSMLDGLVNTNVEKLDLDGDGH